MQTMEMYAVKGEERESFFSENYKQFDKDVSPEELIEMIKSPKVNVHEAIRKIVVEHTEQ